MWLSEEKTSIEIGDHVFFKVSENIYFVGRVVGMPTATGDSWKIIDTSDACKGELHYIQNYLFMSLRAAKQEGK